ncbi:MAG: bifunctional phosphopantothenoylcysteine decarboxylase/phosphopantothenate--cysteine ligase CoaBC [Dehalococcoidia bacterium]|nr:MAG: bifunctional phosphopantothenoylcysteine decarboxylase/phosphopantothenate--cysteine ligase CoaBC [Dehalococcoidia bacterium]
MLENKRILLGVTGGIAVYKAADFASQLSKAGAQVHVIMTASATEFISPLVFSSLTGNEVATSMFATPEKPDISHIRLAEKADLVIIAPATANIIAKLAAGIADDVLTSTILATTAPVIIAPSMHHNMYTNAITQENIKKLKSRGFSFIEPETGRLASGDIGIGRLPAPEKLLAAVEQALGEKGDLAGRKIIVTAGGTREPIDPVRCITNRSSGKMGYALAEAARNRGAKVTLITAAGLPEPVGMKVVAVNTAEEMKKAVAKAVAGCDALIMAAAVADFRPKTAAAQKIKKGRGGLKLDLVATPDILAETKGNFIRVGFAAESDNLLANARKKLAAKQLDIIVANDITDKASTFGSDSNKVTIISRTGKEENLPLLSKREVADKILDRVVSLMGGKNAREDGNVPFQIELLDSHINASYIPLKGYRDSFPNLGGKVSLMTTDGDVVETVVKSYGLQGKALKPWYKRNGLHPRDWIVIRAGPLGNYVLDVLKKKAEAKNNLEIVSQREAKSLLK